MYELNDIDAYVYETDILSKSLHHNKTTSVTAEFYSIPTIY